MIHGLVKFHSAEFEQHRAQINTLLAARAVIQEKLASAPDKAAKQQILELEYRPVQNQIKDLSSRVCLR